jgi:DNA primase small subunit
LRLKIWKNLFVVEISNTFPKSLIVKGLTTIYCSVASGGTKASSRDWVFEKFSSFYKNSSYVFPSPVSFGQREYAFLLFKERAMVRHKSFASSTALRSYMRERIPSDVYHSCAYYENPDAEMEKKGWQGADLVFDIDADHIPTSCNKTHDSWTCTKCGAKGNGETPEICPKRKCGGEKFETKTWACDLCIDSTRNETRKLLDILSEEFGFSENEIHTFFSGHRGYHIHVENEAVHSLDTMARKEIVDYVSGIGLSIFDKSRKVSSKSKTKSTPPEFRLSDYGWNGRIKRGLRNFVKHASIYDLAQAGLNKTSSDVVFNNRELIVKRCFENNLWNINEIGFETWIKLAEHVKNREAAQVDTVVTTDIHRLIRANGTLHGKTGLLKVEFPLKGLDRFDPFVGAVAFKEGTAKVQVSEAPEFKMSGESFGPFKNQTVELPTAAAILLILRNRAEVSK